MNKEWCPICRERRTHCRCPKFDLRLKGVPGPEQGLVGESRSDSETSHAEAAKPGERAVGEIAYATELRRHLTRKIEEAHREWREARANRDESRARDCGLMHDVLVDLRADFDRITEKRSDLSNEKSPCAGANEKDHE